MTEKRTVSTLLCYGVAVVVALASLLLAKVPPLLSDVGMFVLPLAAIILRAWPEKVSASYFQETSPLSCFVLARLFNMFLYILPKWPG